MQEGTPPFVRLLLRSALRYFVQTLAAFFFQERAEKDATQHVTVKHKNNFKRWKVVLPIFLFAAWLVVCYKFVPG